MFRWEKCCHCPKFQKPFNDSIIMLRLQDNLSIPIKITPPVFRVMVMVLLFLLAGLTRPVWAQSDSSIISDPLVENQLPRFGIPKAADSDQLTDAANATNDITEPNNSKPTNSGSSHQQPLVLDDPLQPKLPKLDEIPAYHGVHARQQPRFIEFGPQKRERGVYFGVGFRQVRVDLREGNHIVGTDSTVNGIGFNLGYFWSASFIEYTRHVHLLEASETLKFKEDEYDHLEIIQNNFWYFLSPRISRDFYVHYGIGYQPSSEARLIRKNEEVVEEDSIDTEIEEDDEESEPIIRHDSMLFGFGFSYFLTSNFFIQYRLTQGNFTPIFSGQGTEVFVVSSQIHTLFLEYYFSL